MYQFIVGVNSERHDVFVKKHPLCNLLQSSSWAKIKENWGSVIVGVEDDGELIASALVLIKSLPLGFTMLYIPRGPIMDYENAQVVKFFMLGLKKYAKTKKCLFIKMDPGIHYKDYHLDEEKVVNDKIPVILENLKNAGTIHQSLSLDIDSTIQPRFQANVYQNEFDETLFSKSMKKMLGIAQKKQVLLGKAGVECVQDFSVIMNLTTQRKQISLRSESYFKRLLEVYQESFLMMASLDLPTIHQMVKDRYVQNQEQLSNCPENAKKKRYTLEELNTSLTRELKEIAVWREEYGDKVYIAGALVIMYGKTSEILYAGMNDEFKRYMAPYATWYEAMNVCFGKGCTTCNMGGVEGNLKDGLTKFKANFNPMINEFIGEFDLPTSILYPLGKKAFEMYRKRSKD